MSTFLRFSRLLRLSQTATYVSRSVVVRNNTIRLQNKNLTASAILARFQSTSTEPKEDEYHSIIKDTEEPAGQATKHEFQADTKMLLNIVAKSLYSDKEVFVRELISNASDALEKFRYMLLADGEAIQKLKDSGRKLEIHISTNKQARTLTIQDTGIGMTKDELITNLGVIAKSGSKAFIQQLKDKRDQSDNGNIIGQFGVGFYSAFMVAEKVEVYSKAGTEEQRYRWSSDGTGSYEIQPAEGVQYGTKIVVHLKVDCREFADGDTIKEIIQKYSNFVGSPIYLNGTRANVIQPLWLSNPKTITLQQHAEFYKYISNSYDLPRYTLHYNTDVPLSIHALLYFPEGKPGLFEMSMDTNSSVALYSRKILIKHKTDNILPKWLRFVKGVVDSEDILLNLSRELLQNSALIRKLRNVLTQKILKFLKDEKKKKPEEYEKFHADYSQFLKEGIVMSHDQNEKEEIATLLLFESSHKDSGIKVGLEDYISRIKDDQKVIFYLAAPSRTLAEASPYYENLKNRNQEVLFCYEPYDELVLMHLRQFKNYNVVSVEKDMRDDKKAADLSNLGADSLKRSEIDELTKWLKDRLAGKAAVVSATNRLENHPCVVTVEEMAAARHFMKSQAHQVPEEKRYALLQPQFEINQRRDMLYCNHNSKLIQSKYDILLSLF
ncbi:hypothetical protein AMK59_6630 [Oryctes borbonicus]|uniref:Heat shock protein 83 n=1 Tax=Oryctes borbonicus TaxID=1629725 RepID=A0A0T6AUW8_9SCAR|nr:hypothetical protein AMK59_6630 [Oryctes borbonicus]